MTSLALCSAALDFYIQYLTAKGANPAAYLNLLDQRMLNLNEELGRLEGALERDYWRTDVPEFPGGFHDWVRVKSDGTWLRYPVLNFTLFPLYYGTPLQYPERARNDVFFVQMELCYHQPGILPGELPLFQRIGQLCRVFIHRDRHPLGRKQER